MKTFSKQILYVIVFLMLNQSFVIASCNEKKETVKRNKQYETDSVLQDLPEIDLDYISIIQGVKHSLPLNNYFYKRIGEIPGLSESINSNLSGSLQKIQTLFHYSFQMLSSSAGGFGPSLPGIGNSETVRNYEDVIGFFQTKDVEIIHKQEWDKLSFSLKKAIVEMLLAADEANTVYRQFSEPVRKYLEDKSSTSTAEIYEELMIPWKQKELKDFESVEIIEKADLKKLSFATRLLADKLNWFFARKKIIVPDDFKGCIIKSCLGELLISGTNNDTINEEHFFILELGGDDVYTDNTASSISINQPLGVVVDLEGNDEYLCEDKFLVAGILGIAVLIDLNGDDYYYTNKPGVAFSLYGSSMLYDYTGNDVYVVKSNYSQAAAYIGSSLFVDVSGDDDYICQSYSQGFGGTLGVGLFYDQTGDDRYNAINIEEGEDSFSQSFVQGAARGRWAEATDGQSLAGGIGVFIDNTGIDEYSARSFSQGASYYFGLGIFSDNMGNDIYNAISHSQGYAAHYSLAAFSDKRGDDQYNPLTNKEKVTQIIGSGRDFSAGLFIEMDGDDTYHLGNRSAGIGDLNGIGVLADYKGNDKYIWHKNKVNSGSPSLGKLIGISQKMGVGLKVFMPSQIPTAGILFDSQGENKFESK